MSSTVTFKRGSTYAATVTYTPAAGGPANLLTTTVTTDIIDAGNGLSFVLSLSETSAFALGNARQDVKFATGGVVFYSSTFRLNVIDQVTA